MENLPIHLSNLGHSQGSESEIDYNTAIYFIVDHQGLIHVIPKSFLRRIISNPLGPWMSRLPEMKMRVSYGNGVVDLPFHLPCLNDNLFLSERGSVFCKWLFEKLDTEMSPEVLPASLNLLVDPIPQVDFHVPVVPSDEDVPYRVTLASCSDGFIVFETTTHLTDIYVGIESFSFPGIPSSEGKGKGHLTKLSLNAGSDRDGTPTIDPGCKIVLWNARGISRPSFARNIRTIMNVHSPEVVILPESRTSYENAQCYLRNILGADFNKRVVCGKGIDGGVTLIWNQTEVVNVFHSVECGKDYELYTSIVVDLKFL